MVWAGLRVNLTRWEPDGGWHNYTGMEVGMHKQFEAACEATRIWIVLSQRSLTTEHHPR